MSETRHRRSAFCFSPTSSTISFSLAALLGVLLLVGRLLNERSIMDGYMQSINGLPTPQHEEHGTTRHEKRNDSSTGSTSSFVNQVPRWNESVHSSNLPSWMKDYMEWHHRERTKLVEQLDDLETWSSTSVAAVVPINGSAIIQHRPLPRPKNLPPFLILQCLKTTEICGGLSDRLKPLPLLVLGAYRHQYLLLIQWEVPAPLEEFMVPPVGGLDWRVPPTLKRYIDGGKESTVQVEKYFFRQVFTDDRRWPERQNTTDILAVGVKLQSHDGGMGVYQEFLELQFGVNATEWQPSFEDLYHNLFRIFFEPAPGIQLLLDKVYATTPLDAGNYAIAHFRALWKENNDPPSMDEMEKYALNAVYCSSQLGPDDHRPIYFATDSIDAHAIMTNYSNMHKQAHVTNATVQHLYRPIVVLPQQKLLHLDRVRIVEDPIAAANVTGGKNIRPGHKVDTSLKFTSHVEDIYPVFVDLWLMAQGHCVAYGEGGFGHYGLLLSHNSSCGFKHTVRKVAQTCSWRE